MQRFKILVWSRGLNNIETQDALVNIVRQQNPSIVFLSETLAAPDLLTEVRRRIGFDGVICSPREDDCRGLGLFWRNEVPVRLRNYSANHIDVEVGAVGSEGAFQFTGVYGVATAANQNITRNLLRTLARQIRLPWLVAGDFNEILCLADKSGGPPRCVAQMNRFCQALVDCELMDMGSVGSHYIYLVKSVYKRKIGPCVSEFPLEGALSLFPGYHPPSEQVSRKIKQNGNLFLSWNTRVFQQGQVELKLIQGKLDELMKTHYEASQFDEQRALQTRLNELMSINETYWRQRSKIQWLREVAIETILDCLQTRVTEDMNSELLAPYLDDEIKRALFQMHPSKSPGPDGMSPCFFQKFWDVVESDVCRAVREVLLTGQISQESNFTHLTLIPKIKEPKLASDLRPIALCNVVYRIASKVLANRLKKILLQIISPLQSAFVPGRLISDNTLVATEVAHFMKKLKRQAEGFFSLKLDISKAYDRLEWQYLEAILLKLGFCKKWVNINMATVKSVSYSILINGTPTGFILPTRGIRQGDPLSPYLFILCAEGLSALISSSVQHGYIAGLVMSPSAPVIHHLLFADDCFLFGEASVRECQAFNNILSTYAQASGQKINLQKSSVVFSGNVGVPSSNQLATVLGVKCVKEHGMYLGLPIHVGHNKTAIFAYLKERLTKKLLSWRSKILSAGGKELLIKAVAQTLPNYVMNCYLLPKSLCDDLQQLCSQFFWGSTNEKKKIHWRSWDRMCLPNEQGGMGFKHLHSHDLATIYLQKSSVVFSGNVGVPSSNQLAAVLGVKCVKEHGMYLGLPIHVGHNKTAIFAYLKERLTKKLLSWRSKILSAGGKEFLIKAVAQTLPNYVMNCYLLPKSLCDDLQQLCSQFFWGSTNEKKKIHWRSWDRMCLPNEQGGMGFKHLHSHNLAMLSKQGWRILSNPNSVVAQVFKAVYYPNGSFLTADRSITHSYSWRSIMEARPILTAGLFWRIGNGTSVNIWEDE
ncbi:uncharacterized protein LOC112199901 [Rosa chinensis]|uniref:uncharacterized protein LOC112199901 n=1 Tax=Rosa chinensis TaxID=74649 RepID=UPI000D08A7BC|nr:uncharacterized protein LOC112199901 [Rosa chinensis]